MPPIGWKHSEESKKQISTSRRGMGLGNQNAAGTFHTPETRDRISKALRGRVLPEATRQRVAASVRRNWKGGYTGDAFAEVLCPAGFVREHVVQWGNRNGERYYLDFAHVEGKVNIELDGPWHMTTPQQDANRDHILQLLGWRVIRITH